MFSVSLSEESRRRASIWCEWSDLGIIRVWLPATSFRNKFIPRAVSLGCGGAGVLLLKTLCNPEKMSLWASCTDHELKSSGFRRIRPGLSFSLVTFNPAVTRSRPFTFIRYSWAHQQHQETSRRDLLIRLPVSRDCLGTPVRGLGYSLVGWRLRATKRLALAAVTASTFDASLLRTLPTSPDRRKYLVNGRQEVKFTRRHEYL